MITKTAIKIDDKVFYGNKGERHAEVIKRIIVEGLADMDKPHEMGFVDERGVYYTRSQAAAEAYKCGQIEKQMASLTSEDLW